MPITNMQAGTFVRRNGQLGYIFDITEIRCLGKVIIMATKSITKEIHVKDRQMGRSLVLALENAERKKGDDVVFKKSVKIVRKDEIKKLFGY